MSSPQANQSPQALSAISESPSQREDQTPREVNSLESLSRKYPCIVSLDTMQETVSKELKKPWDISTQKNNLLVVLPSNIDELVANNYLIRLYTRVLWDEGYKSVISTTAWSSRLRPDAATESFLQSFGIFALSRKVPKLPSQRGTVWKGIASSIKCWLGGKINVDISLTKVSKAPTPVEVVFGGDTGKNYPCEKQMLDHLVHYLRVGFNAEGNYNDFLLSKEKIVDDKGLTCSLESEMISPVEKSFIKGCLKLKDIEIEKFDLVVPNIGSVKELNDFQSAIQDRQTSIRKAKTLIKDTVSYRISACYEPLKKGKGKLKSKLPVKVLRENIKHSSLYYRFNPSVWAQLVGISPLPDKLRLASENPEKFYAAIDQWAFELEGKDGLDKSSISSLKSEFLTYSDDSTLD